MSFKELFKKIQSSKEFKSFKEKNKNTFLFSAFFVLLPDFSTEKQQLDYYISEKKKVVTFFIENDQVKHRQEDFKPKDRITKLDEKIKIDFPGLQEIIEKEIRKQKLTTFSVNKIIAILQKQKQKQIWNMICLLDGLKMLRIHVDCFNGKIIESKQGSMLDFVQVK